MGKKLYYLFLLPLLFFGCSEETIKISEDDGKYYYPMQVGSYWVYDVSETKYIRRAKNQPGDSITYQIRERVDTVFKNQANELTYKIIRSRRARASAAWGADSVILVNVSALNAQITQNNKRVVNLVFPVTPEKKWNGNAYNQNSGSEEEFYYQHIGQPYTLRDTTFAKTVTVVHYQNENIIDFDDRHEVYAADVGLIYKKYVDYEYCGSAAQSCNIGEGFIVYGIKRIQKIRSYYIKK